jgi:hypothetical protein
MSRRILLAIGSSITIAACSGADQPNYQNSDPQPDQQAGASAGADGGAKAAGSSSGGPSGGGAGNACASTTASISPQSGGMKLVFMFDRSGSMKKDQKWDACKSALKAFFADPKSAGVSASLQFFASQDHDRCDPNSYVQPAVPMTPLPDGRFAQTIDATPLYPEGETPTLPALKGALDYASTLGPNAAVVLVTDGIPNACDGSGGGDPAKVDHVATAAAAAGAVKTYVIGLGNTSALNEIAQSGGTNSAFVVPTNDPGQISSRLMAALGTIASSSASCEYNIPQSTKGQATDINGLSVTYTPANGSATSIPRANGCSGNDPGWTFNDANTPTKVVLCPGSCSAIQGGPGKIDVTVPCANKGNGGSSGGSGQGDGGAGQGDGGTGQGDGGTGSSGGVPPK